MAAGRFRISASRPWWDLHPLGGSLPRTRSAVGAGHPSARGIPLSLPSFLLPFVRLKHCPGRFPKPSSRASPPARSGFQPFSLPAELHRPPLYYYYHYFFFFLSSFFVGCFLRKLTRSRGGAGAARSCPPQPGSAPAPRGVAGPLLRAGGQESGEETSFEWGGEGRAGGGGRAGRYQLREMCLGSSRTGASPQVAAFLSAAARGSAAPPGPQPQPAGSAGPPGAATEPPRGGG